MPRHDLASDSRGTTVAALFVEQLDLFDLLEPAPQVDAWWLRSPFDEWGDRCLRDLAERPARLYPGGYMGFVHEELVARGHATSTPDGIFEPPATLTPKQAKAWRKEAADCPVSLYQITEAGRAILASNLKATANREED